MFGSIKIINFGWMKNIDYIEVNEAEVEQLAKDFIKAFDLSNPPLFRVQLIKVAFYPKI